MAQAHYHLKEKSNPVSDKYSVFLYHGWIEDYIEPERFNVFYPEKYTPPRSYPTRVTTRKRRTYAKIMSALENYPLSQFRFLTVTTSPESPQARDVEGLRLAWKEFVRRMRRKFGVFEYLAVVEMNKRRNLLHIHALIRSPYIPQDVLSREWEKITKAYVVFITALYYDDGGKRMTGNELDFLDKERKREVMTKVAAYLTKYLTKENKRIQKRVWISRHWSERWNMEKRMCKIGINIDKKVGTESFWRVEKRILEKARMGKEVTLEVYTIGLSGAVKLGIQTFRLRNWYNPEKYVVLDRKIVSREKLREIEAEINKFYNAEFNICDDKDQKNEIYDNEFWQNLIEYLDTDPINAPPA